jgi:cyanophycin synthetase
MKLGIPMEEVVGYVAKELQVLAGIQAEYIKTDEIREGIHQLAFSYTEENAAIYAGKAAVSIVEALISEKKHLDIQPDIIKLMNLSNAAPELKKEIHGEMA